ncbi:MAG: ferredoxin family protein [Methanobacteriota archaeon]|nr:MAG: ferredoxin family protein [Euryarchaeota archaeon]
MAQDEYGNIPREDIKWFPKVDKGRCTLCRVCVDFCHQGVFEADDEAEAAEVVRPYSCIVGCTGCAGQCPAGAISFPSLPELRDMLKTLRARYDVD